MSVRAARAMGWELSGDASAALVVVAAIISAISRQDRLTYALLEANNPFVGRITRNVLDRSTSGRARWCRFGGLGFARRGVAGMTAISQSQTLASDESRR